MSCCILHNIIHTYDRRLEWERENDWAGVDGRLAESFVAHGGVDFSSVGYRVSRLDQAVDVDEEVEPDFYSLRRDLVCHYRSAHECDEVTWLRLEAGSLQ